MSDLSQSVRMYWSNGDSAAAAGVDIVCGRPRVKEAKEEGTEVLADRYR